MHEHLLNCAPAGRRRHTGRLLGVATRDWLYGLGVTATVLVAGCGGSSSPSGQTPSQASSPPPPSSSVVAVDPGVAFEQLERARKPFDCSTALYDLNDAAYREQLSAMAENARKYRGLIATWDGELGKIVFPSNAQQIAATIHALNTSELKDLDAIAAVAKPDSTLIFRLTNGVQFHDWSVVVEVDHLDAALGHPNPPARVAANQLELAYRAFYYEVNPVFTDFEAALARNDLPGAKAANGVEEAAAQRFIDALKAAGWPPGFETQVSGLQANLRAIIDFDRRQVDVATAAEVVRVPEEGSPEVKALDDNEAKLWNDLVALAEKTDPPPRC